MTKLNQAWDTTIGIISGGQGTFISFEQSLNQTAQAAHAAGASMSGLSSPSLALRSSWQSSYQDGAKLIDALRMMSSASPGGFPALTPAVKDVIAQLLPLGKQSKATRAELVAMAQEVQPNVKNFTDLTHWLGSTRNAGQALNSILAKDGLNLQNIAADAAKAGNMMQSSVTAQFNQAKMAANGTDTAISKLASAIAKGGATARAIHGDELVLYDDLRKDGMSAQQAANLITALTGKLFKIPKNVQTRISVPGATYALSLMQQLTSGITWIRANGNLSVNVNYTQTGKKATGGVVGQAAATGGVRGGWTLVGEQGPELARLPTGSQVSSNPDTMRMLGGAQQPQVVRLEITGGDSDFAQFMGTFLRRYVRVNGGIGPNSVQRALGRT